MDEIRKLVMAHDPGDGDTGSDMGNGPSSDGSSAGDSDSSYDSGSYEG